MSLHQSIIASTSPEIEVSEKACSTCAGTGKPVDGTGHYFDDDAGCFRPDYCDTCEGTGLVAVTCEICEGVVDRNGWCAACEERAPAISDMTKRYWADPVYRAQLTAERDAITRAWFAEADAEARAEQERRWARDEQLLMDAGLSDDAIASVLSGEDLPDAELRA